VIVKSSISIPDDIYVQKDDTSDSEHVVVESSISVQIARYSLVILMIKDEIEH